MLLIVQISSFPGPRPDVHRPALRRVLAFLGFWVQQAPHEARRIGAARCAACITLSRRGKPSRKYCTCKLVLNVGNHNSVTAISSQRGG
jgi:hypothetical protein